MGYRLQSELNQNRAIGKQIKELNIMGLSIGIDDQWHDCSHNVREIAIAVGIYSQLWRGENHPEIQRCCHLVEPLDKAIAFLKDNRNDLLHLNPENGWGSVDSLLQFLKDLRASCQLHRRKKFAISR